MGMEMRAAGLEPTTYGLIVCHSATLPHVKLHATRGLTMFSGEFRFVGESVNPARKARQRRVNLRVPEGGVGYSVSSRFPLARLSDFSTFTSFPIRVHC